MSPQRKVHPHRLRCNVLTFGRTAAAEKKDTFNQSDLADIMSVYYRTLFLNGFVQADLAFV